MSEAKELIVAIAKPILKEAGFAKSGSTWWKREKDAASMVHLAAIPGMNHITCNAGVYISALGKAVRPAFHECHAEKQFYVRPANKCPLDFNNALSAGQRRTKFEKLLKQRIIPWLSSIACPSTRRAAIFAGHDDGTFMISDEALQLLGIKNFRQKTGRRIRIHTFELPAGFDPDKSDSAQTLERAFQEITARVGRTTKGAARKRAI